jgi:hypothetical protein
MWLLAPLSAPAGVERGWGRGGGYNAKEIEPLLIARLTIQTLLAITLKQHYKKLSTQGI